MRALEGTWGHVLAIAILVIVPLLFFWEMVAENQEPLAPDTQAVLPLGQWAVEAERENGEVPLWCPGIFSGMPSYGSFIRTLSSPFDLTRWMRHPFSDRRGVRYYLSFLIAGLSLYLLLVRRRLAPPSALVGALAFVMTPYFLGLIAAGHSTKLQALCLAPLVFLALDLLLQPAFELLRCVRRAVVQDQGQGDALGADPRHSEGHVVHPGSTRVRRVVSDIERHEHYFSQ